MLRQFAAAALLACAGGIAFGAAIGTATVTAAGLGASPLAGPRVDAESGRETLVSHGLRGEVLGLEAPPAIAALGLLDLGESSEAKIHDLLAERAVLMDGLVLSNIELLAQVETVMAVGSAGEKFRMLQQGLAALAPVREWGRLEARLGEALPPAQREAYRALIDEYEDAHYRHALASGAVEHRFEHRLQRHWEDLAWEIERSAERVLTDDGDGDAWLEMLTERLDLTPDQAGQIRAKAERFFIETAGRPTEAQERAFIADIRTVMTVRQRWAFTVMMLKGDLEPDADG